MAGFWRDKILTKANMRGLLIALAITALLFLIGAPPE
jgi:hypothetical protein